MTQIGEGCRETEPANRVSVVGPGATPSTLFRGASPGAIRPCFGKPI